METLQVVERFNRLNEFIEEGRLLRNEWTNTDDAGRERACLLAAISPEVAESHEAGSCPMWLLPQWFAELVPSMDDYGTEGAWPDMVKRFAAVVGRAAKMLDASRWERVKFRCLSAFVREAKSHTTEQTVIAVCDTVIGLCDRAANGDIAQQKEWSAAESAAWSAAWSAAAWSAARLAADSAARLAADSAARSAVESAAWSAAKSAAAESARSAAWSAAAESAAWDRINSAILDTIEKEMNDVL